MQWDTAEIKLHVLAFFTLQLPKDVHMLYFKLCNYCCVSFQKNITVDRKTVLHCAPAPSHKHMKQAKQMHKYTTISFTTVFYRQTTNKSMRSVNKRLVVVSSLRAFPHWCLCLHCKSFVMNYIVSEFRIICQKIRIINAKDINISVNCPFKTNIKV